MTELREVFAIAGICLLLAGWLMILTLLAATFRESRKVLDEGAEENDG